MKKLIKDWWPLLLIAGVWLWKKLKQKNSPYTLGNSGNGPIMPTQERVIQDYIQQLKKAGYTEAGNCPICGSKQYMKGYGGNPDTGAFGFALHYACTNMNCENFDNRFVLDY